MHIPRALAHLVLPCCLLLCPACGGRDADSPAASSDAPAPRSTAAVPAPEAPGADGEAMAAAQDEMAKAMQEFGRAFSEAMAAGAQEMADAAAESAQLEGEGHASAAQMEAAMAEGMQEMSEAMNAGMEQAGEAMAEGMAEGMEVMGEMLGVMLELGPQLEAMTGEYDLDTPEGMRAAADNLAASAALIRERAETVRPEVQHMLEQLAQEMDKVAALARTDPAAAVALRQANEVAKGSEIEPGMPSSAPD